MALNPASTTDQAATIARAAEQAAANAAFLTILAPLVDTAAANGELAITVHTSRDMNLQDLATTLVDLGYGVAFIDSKRVHFQPTEFFGAFWENYWSTGGHVPSDVKSPTRVKISWKNA